MESSGGREDQFWANGVSEPLPLSSRPNRRAHSSHRADHERSRRAPSPIPYPSSSPLHTTHLAMEDAVFLPTPSRRKVVSSTSLSRKKPHLARVPTPHALVSNRALSRMTRSAGPYSSSPSRNNPKIYRSSRTAEGSPHSVRWNQSAGQPGPSSNYEYQRSPMSSNRNALHMPPLSALYQTRSHLEADGNVSPSFSADGFLSPLHASSRRTSPLSMTPLIDYSVPSASPQNLEKLYDTSSHLGGGGELEALFDASDSFWPYDSTAFHENDLSLLWSGDQASQQPGQLTPMDHTAMLFPALPITSDNIPVPPDARHRTFPFTQLSQPSPEPIPTSSLNEYQAVEFIRHTYESPNDARATNQFTDFYFPHPSVDAMSLDSFPNIVQDEDGLLHLGRAD